MRLVCRVFGWFVILLLALIAGAAVWLWLAPPALIQVASNYSAKTVCSNVFIAGRDAATVLSEDVQAPGHPLLKWISVDVDREAKTVRAGLLGLFGNGLAVARDGLGCTTMPDGDAFAGQPAPVVPPAPPAAAGDALWPQGERAEISINTAIARILDDPEMTGPGMRAVVVVVNGRIAGERYAEGFDANTPLLGWSMAKSVNAAVLGTVVKAGKLSLEKTRLFETWKQDGRAAISVADLMAMSSGLEYNESYGDVSDVTRMLFLEPDMAGFAAAKPLTAPVGTNFTYSSGTAMILSRLWQDAVGENSLAWPREKLFSPIGMTSAVIETDAAGTFAGSSFIYATARDWARFGLFLAQDGVWEGLEILPKQFVALMHEAAPASKGAYSKAQTWLEGPGGNGADALPADAFWLQGHDGQTVAIIPSHNLVVARLGLTPSKFGYRPQRMAAALVQAVEKVSE